MMSWRWPGEYWKYDLTVLAAVLVGTGGNDAVIKPEPPTECSVKRDAETMAPVDIVAECNKKSIVSINF